MICIECRKVKHWRSIVDLFQSQWYKHDREVYKGQVREMTEMTDRKNRRQANPRSKIPLGISACLLGENVRYDGGHKLDHYLSDTLGQFVKWVPVCPEVECGLPVPREAMRLVGDPAVAAAGDPVHPHRPYRPDEAMVREKAGGTGETGPVRVRVQGPVAELRHGAGEGLFRIGNLLQAWARACSRRPSRSTSP